jgi:hypothetical protein
VIELEQRVRGLLAVQELEALTFFGHKGRPGVGEGGSAPREEVTPGPGVELSKPDFSDKDRKWAEGATRIANTIAEPGLPTRINMWDSASSREIDIRQGVFGNEAARRIMFTVFGDTASLDFVQFRAPVSPKVARAVLRETFNTLQDLGVKRLKVDAALEDGGYLWARLGFRAYSSVNFAHEVRQRLDAIAAESKQTWDWTRQVAPPVGLKDTTVTRVRKMLDTHSLLVSGRLPQAISDLRIDRVNVGRRLLRGMAWKGQVDFSDKVFQRRVNHFLGSAA